MNMKNKSKMTVVMSSAGSPSKIGALEMLVSFALQTWSEKARNRVRGEAGTVFAKGLGTARRLAILCNVLH